MITFKLQDKVETITKKDMIELLEANNMKMRKEQREYTDGLYNELTGELDELRKGLLGLVKSVTIITERRKRLKGPQDNSKKTSKESNM